MKGGEKMEKKNLVFLSVIAIVFLLSVTFVSAGWWNDLFGGNSVTGRAVDSYKIQNIVVKEKVKCVFKDATTTQECYSNKGKCKGIGTCAVDVKGKKGEQVTWKSTCGGYAYTTMDGQNDYAEFKCGTITPGFYKAFWECYDGYHIQASSKKSLISETWNKYAQEDCRGHCYDDGSKCGVNSFGVLE